MQTREAYSEAAGQAATGSVQRLNHIESELGELRNELRGLRTDLDSRFRWLLGVQITMWVTIMLAILLA